MSEKIKKPIKDIPIKTIEILAGCVICLLSISLIIDVRYVARTFNYLFFFFFGYGSYFIYALLLMFGIYLILNRKVKFKHKFLLTISIILALIGVLSILTLSLSSYDVTFPNFSVNFLDVLHDGLFYHEDYIDIPFLFNPDHLSLGGGAIGYLFASTFNLFDNIVFSYFVPSLLIFMSILIICLPYIISAIKKATAKSKSKKEQIKQEILNNPQIQEEINNENLVTTLSRNNQNKIYTKKEIKNSSMDVIRQASVIYHPEENKEDIYKDDIATSNVNTESLYFNNSNYQKVGGLSKAHYYRPNEMVSNNQVNNNNDLYFKEQNQIPEEPQNIEQMTFDLPEPEPEPKVEPAFNNYSNQNIMPQPQVVPTPVVNQVPQPEPQIQQPVNNKYSHNVVFQEKAEDNSIKDVHTISFERQTYTYPSLDLLMEYDNSQTNSINNEAALDYLGKINETFDTFKVRAQATEYIIGPSVTQFAITYDTGVSYRNVDKIVDDISIRLGGVSARFEPIVAGKTYSGLQIPNAKMCTVGFKEVLEQLPDPAKKPLSLAFGKNIQGEIVYADLDDFPHMLVAGTTGSGKSIFIHSVVMTLIMRNNPADLRIILVDPKQVEMRLYENMPHLLCPIITKPEEVAVCLSKLVDEMENRYTAFGNYKVTNIKQYNAARKAEGNDTMPYILVVLDEYSDLVDRAKDVSRYVISLTQKSRACGIHLMVATQRPSTKVIDGVIKANLPTHVALMTSSAVDSITIIGEGGAEKLLGKGDLLVQSPLVSRTGCVRLQSAFVQNSEINSVVQYLKSKHQTVYDSDYLDLQDHSNDVSDNPFINFASMEQGSSASNIDPKYEEVKKAAMAEEYFSISKITRIFGFGFTRAGKVFNQLQNDGIVAKNKDAKSNSKGCKVLIHDDSYGIDVENTSDEVSSTETIDEYIKNSEYNDGAY